MGQLEDITKGAAVRGILPDGLVTVIDVRWVGTVAVEVTYKDSAGRLGNELIYRDREPTLEVVEVGRPWSFDGNGNEFRLLSEANRIRLTAGGSPFATLFTETRRSLDITARVSQLKLTDWTTHQYCRVALLLFPLSGAAALLLIHWLVGRFLYAGQLLFEHENGLEHEQREFAGRLFRQTVFDGISDRLLNSPHAELRDSAFIGWMCGPCRYPVLFADPMWVIGIHVLGAMRSGKTHRFILSLLLQRIRQKSGPVCVLDLKGDNVLFQAVRRECAWTNRKFIYFTNVDQFSTYLFNPLHQKNIAELSVAQFCQIMINALNLWHGFFYGGSHFGMQSVCAFAAALRLEQRGKGWVCGPNTVQVETFDELESRIRRVIKSNPEFGGAHSLLMVMRELANILQLNFPKKKVAFPSRRLMPRFKFLTY